MSLPASATSAAQEPAPSPAVLSARGLTKHFRVGGVLSRNVLHAVDEVDLTIKDQEIVSLVGESGSGKSTVARLLAGLYTPTAGQIRFRDRPLSRMGRSEYRRHVQMVFQDPYSSLNPVFRASHGVMRSLKRHRMAGDRGSRRRQAVEILDSVGLVPGDEMLRKYPHELSGGQRQRFGFAQALACRPSLILADEPVSMLDVSIRIGVLNLMQHLRQDRGVSFLYITHDIASARYVADRVMVMYAARVVEEGPTEAVLSRPAHPYTRLLLSAVPDPYAPDTEAVGSEVSEPPRVVNPGEGCRFRWRCPLALDICSRVTPPLEAVGPGHFAACHVTAPSGGHA
ncbi:MAG TPA: ABC transporter ATP-binding protein [Chloroflexota bacterium]|nr:ABC transporter ATP-binding protein [Chloroflexota bacterium]